MSLSDRKRKAGINLYFQVHQPRRLAPFSYFDIGSDNEYFDDVRNRAIIQRVARNSYERMNRLMLRLIERFPNVRITFSLSGVVMEQLERYAPDVLDTFVALARTGNVEFLGETYYHSLASVASPDEFVTQIRQHTTKLNDLFGCEPVVFRNTELIYNDSTAAIVSGLGFKGIYIEGAASVIGKKHPGQLFRHPKADVRLIPRYYSLSDDIAFRYADRRWKYWPLTSSLMIDWMERLPVDYRFVSLGMDYETFGEHLRAESGIFDFAERFITALARRKRFRFVSLADAVAEQNATEELTVPDWRSWADRERDVSAWLGNDMQQDAFHTLFSIQKDIMKYAPHLLDQWRYLQTSDHFYYMSTKTDADGGIHRYFSPYESPYLAFMNYMNVLSDLAWRVNEAKAGDQHRDAVESAHHFAGVVS
jgi:alpha-amylase